jgi:outer membrane protein
VPKSNPGTIAGNRADLDGSGAPTLSGSWFVNDNVAVELWGAAGKFEQDVNLSNGTRGSMKQQPIAVSGQYHFGQASQPIRPYVGLGYYQANIDNEHFDPTVAAGQHVGLARPTAPSPPWARTSTSPTVVRACRCALHAGDSDVSIKRQQDG